MSLHDGRHRSGSGSSLPAMPGSPTLTNPDMILPDYNPPDSPDRRAESPLTMWTQAHTATGIAYLPLPEPARQSVHSTPIIYGNGTMLSDIGEVTEMESNAGVQSRRTSSQYSSSTIEAVTYGTAHANKPIMGMSSILARERHASIDSTSTITSKRRRSGFGDFDDGVSVDDSNFQGDDEESTASSVIGGTSPRESGFGVAMQPSNFVNDRFSTSSISQRAEAILANAKRRLTAMEGNLTRARSSLNVYSDGSTPSPTPSRPAIAMRDSIVSNSVGHSRIKSEDGITSMYRPFPFPIRSASALGSAGGYRPPRFGSRIVQDKAKESEVTAVEIPHQPLDTTVEESSEDDDSDLDMHSSSYLSPTFASYSDKTVTRSASAAQMREIQDQMQGLKGKISSLKQQAKADSMKRRSLQSLRTPSPFTHSRWDHDSAGSKGSQSPKSGEGTPRTPWTADPIAVQVRDGSPLEEGQVDAEMSEEVQPIVKGSDGGDHGAVPLQSSVEVPEEEEPRNEIDLSPVEDSSPQMSNGVESHEKENGVLQEVKVEEDVEEDVPDWDSESDESLYHDSHQNPVSHEDREDAFDYQNFFLHSAMGRLRRSERRDSSSSFNSDSSVETTRATPSHFRSHSSETISSVESFATATEGRASRSSTAQGKRTVSSGNEIDEPTPNIHDYFGEHQSAGREQGVRQNSMLRRPASATPADARAHHRPSISSFESIGTNRSFPLVNKAKLNEGVLTPGGSPDAELKQVSDALMKDTIRASENGKLSPVPELQHLAKEDQLMVGRLIACLGKSVMELGEASRASVEARAERRKIEAARRILEGLDEA